MYFANGTHSFVVGNQMYNTLFAGKNNSLDLIYRLHIIIYESDAYLAETVFRKMIEQDPEQNTPRVERLRQMDREDLKALLATICVLNAIDVAEVSDKVLVLLLLKLGTHTSKNVSDVS
jgi:hypothetical protein